VHVRFLSGAGIQIWRPGTDEILTPPSYSNPSVWAIALRLPFRANRERIDAWLPDVSAVRAILVGHAHYDHLASVPFILEERAPDATVYASRTAQHLLAGAGLEERVVPLNDVMGNWKRPGTWIYLPDGRARFMALESEHSPHLHGVKILGGTVDEEREALPKTVWGWREGQTFAFLIDLLDRDDPSRVAFRIHYQDAASKPPLGFPPPLNDGVPLDLAILNVAGFHGSAGYPEELLRTWKPRWLLLSHWEDFFRNPEKPRRVVRATNLGAFLERLGDALDEDPETTLAHQRRWTLPDLGARVDFPLCDDAAAAANTGVR
jgi:hypothetical protein